MNIHENIKRLRTEKGLSQEEFAKEIGVSRQSVIKWESGANFPDVDNIGRICKLFGVSFDVLFGISEEQEKSKNTEKSSFLADKWKMLFCIALVAVAVLLAVLIFTIAKINDSTAIEDGEYSSGDIQGEIVLATAAPSPTATPILSAEAVESSTFVYSVGASSLPSELGDLSFAAEEYQLATTMQLSEAQSMLETFSDCVEYFDAFNKGYISSIYYTNAAITDGVYLGYSARINTEEMFSSVISGESIGFNETAVITAYCLADNFENSGYLVTFYNESESGEYSVANYFYIDGYYHVILLEDNICHDNGKLEEKSYTYYKLENLEDFAYVYSSHISVQSNFYTIESVYKVPVGGNLYWQELEGVYQIAGGTLVG